MKGIVDQAGRAILEIQLRCNSSHPFRTISVWIDTGFTGDLVLPQKTIDELGLKPSGTVDGILADGSQTVLTTYHFEIDRLVWPHTKSGSDRKFRHNTAIGCRTIVGKRTSRRLYQPAAHTAPQAEDLDGRTTAVTDAAARKL